MLRAVGYEVVLPNDALRAELRRIGCDTVLSPRDLTKSMGYCPLHIREVGPEAMDRCDLYCDIKAHRCYDKIIARWPRLNGKVLWTRINGGAPEIVPGCGDEINPPCPVLTSNRWYDRPGPWQDRSYARWWPFCRFDEYLPQHGRPDGGWDSPVCLIHGIFGWGYGALIGVMRERFGLRCHGVAAPDGLIPHSRVSALLSRALCMIHLKSSDAPGFSLYEGMAAGCPLVVTRRLIWRSGFEDLLIPGETCLVFDRETHEGLTDDDVRDCTAEVAGHLGRLRDPVENARIGQAGRRRLQEVRWQDSKPEDVASLREFMGRWFP